jgi:hypothetical protein
MRHAGATLEGFDPAQRFGRVAPGTPFKAQHEILRREVWRR